ncbi:dUTP diphosphatase, partial [uncultured Dubosiella sp.]|uniref:dUTP diphosphatase n=1 Tax=uncultured Dubosiella sp. TaxID=1937011 RepID=UPI0032B283D4
MTNSDIVREMLKMQKKLDVAIFEKAGMKAYPKPEQYFLAILDEVGELNHEMKPKWCWWKANPGKVDKEKQLEEL